MTLINPALASESSQKLPEWLTEISSELAQVKGVKGVVLGGSRARGEGKPDSDYDLGIYYDSKHFDWNAVKTIANQYDDSNTPKGFGAPAEWGPWINGGAWLTIHQQKVDFLLRDYDFVAQVISECEQGRFSTHYQIGHPNAFYSFMLMSEVRMNVRLQDRDGDLERLYQRTLIYPSILKKAILDQFSFEAEFTLGLIQKLKYRGDIYYLNGLLFRFTSCVIQILFAMNERYFMNEKGAIDAITKSFPVPRGFGDDFNRLFNIPPDPSNTPTRNLWFKQLLSIWEQVKALKT